MCRWLRIAHTRSPTTSIIPPFKDGNPQYPMWELFPAGEPNTTSLDTPAGFLDDKAVLLFLELKKQGLRNCSPNNCDDKGAAGYSRPYDGC